MPIFLCVTRRAQCTLCSGAWDLEPQEYPERCPACGSADWEWGIESSDSRYIRQQISRLRKVLNPGATSKKRQDHGRRQYQGFKPKPVDETSEGT